MESLVFFEDEKETYRDFGLIPVKKLVFESPATKTNFVDIAGSDNSLDLSEALTGYPTYEDRKGSFKFRFYDNGKSARVRLTKFMNFLHGKRKLCIISDEPDWYYDARWQVVDPEFKKVGEFMDIEIEYIAKAYKLEITDTTEDWLWDPFNFETGVIREYGQIKVDNDPVTVTVIGSRKPTIPKFEVTRNTLPVGVTPVLMMDFNDKPYELDYGTNIFPEIVLMDAEYEMTFTGNAFVTIDFRGGSL